MSDTKKNRRDFVLGAASLAAAAGWGGTAWAQGREPVKVGLMSSKSGVFAQQGEEVIRGAQFAIEEANSRGGIDGRRIEVQEADDESSPEAGRRVAEKLARDGYRFLIGAIPSSISLALAPNLERWDAVYFAVISKSDKITGDSCRARMFRTTQSDSMDLAMIGEWSKSFDDKSFASISADYAWGRDSSESFARSVKAQGKDVKLQLYAPLGTKDFSPFIAQLKAANVDAIWVTEPGRDAIAFIKQAAEFGLIPRTRLIGHGLVLNFIVNATDALLRDTPSTTGYAPDIDTARNKAFVAAWKAKFNRLPTDNEGAAYHGAQVMLDGIRRAHSVKPADVVKALQGATLDSIYGPVQMRADNQLMVPNYVVRAKVVDGVLRPVMERTYPPSLTPAPSPLCKMNG